MSVRLLAIVALIFGGAVTVGAQHAESTHAPATSAPASATHAVVPNTAAKPAAPATTVKRPDMKTVVERIQQRIDEEVSQAEPAKPAPARRAGTRTAPPVPPPSPTRVRLVWRVSLEWPDELLEQP